jgi:hypothetical protein
MASRLPVIFCKGVPCKQAPENREFFLLLSRLVGSFPFYVTFKLQLMTLTAVVRFYPDTRWRLGVCCMISAVLMTAAAFYACMWAFQVGYGNVAVTLPAVFILRMHHGASQK